MTNEHQKQDGRTPDLVELMRTMACMISTGEKVSLPYEVELIETSAAEVERLRAKLAEAEAEVGKVISDNFKRAAEITARAEAAEKRMAEARAVIEPFVNRYNEMMQITSGRRVAATYVDAAHLRAAAKWMEKDE